MGSTNDQDLWTRMGRASHESGIAARCSKLQTQAITADDTLKFLQSLKGKVDETERWQGYTAALGVATYGVVVVTDMLWDLVGRPMAKTPGLMILNKAYEKARDYRVKNTPKNEHIEKLKKLKGALHKVLPKDAQPYADGFVNMAENFTAMTGFMQESNQAAAAVRQAKRNLQRDINKLETSLKELVAVYNEHCLVPENRLAAASTKMTKGKA